MNVFEHNRKVWNHQSAKGESRWCVPVDEATIAQARRGDWAVILTPNRSVPADWFGLASARPHFLDCRLLCLASGGGQQAPVLAAAGAAVTSFDASDVQLAKDQEVAQREGLSIRLERGDMADLSRFADESFDVILHPVSNVFAVDVTAVWRECYRVLAPGGRLLAGFMNPDFYLFDHDALEGGAAPVVRFALPYADTDDAEIMAARAAKGEALEFSHSLDEQIGGQVAAGFAIHGFYEDRWDERATPLDRFMPTSMATLAVKAG